MILRDSSFTVRFCPSMQVWRTSNFRVVSGRGLNFSRAPIMQIISTPPTSNPGYAPELTQSSTWVQSRVPSPGFALNLMGEFIGWLAHGSKQLETLPRIMLPAILDHIMPAKFFLMYGVHELPTLARRPRHVKPASHIPSLACLCLAAGYDHWVDDVELVKLPEWRLKCWTW